MRRHSATSLSSIFWSSSSHLAQRSYRIGRYKVAIVCVRGGRASNFDNMAKSCFVEDAFWMTIAYEVGIADNKAAVCRRRLIVRGSWSPLGAISTMSYKQESPKENLLLAISFQAKQPRWFGHPSSASRTTPRVSKIPISSPSVTIATTHTDGRRYSGSGKV